MPSRILIISAHRGLIDRRIIAETNTVAASGRAVTLVSVPAEVPEGSLHPGVRLVMPPTSPAGRAPTGLLRFARVALAPLRTWVRNRRLKARERFFLQQTPAGPYDAIHCHDLDTLPAALALRDRLAPKAKVIYDAHELFPYQEADRSFQRYWSRIEARYIGAADRIITVNESAAAELSRLYGVPAPAVIYNSCGHPTNPAPLSVEDFYHHFNVAPGGFCVLFQGGLLPLRNLPTLVAAFALLDHSYQLFILGSGPLEKEVRLRCAQQKIGNVHFGGSIPQAELLRYTVHAHLGIIPYEDAGLLNMRCCTPNKLFEFIEARVPICTSDLPELTRVVTEHGIGAAYPMRSPEELAAAIRDCRKRCERGEFTAAARDRARQHFSWNQQSERLLALYEGLGL